MTTFEDMEEAWKTQSAKLDQVNLTLGDQVLREKISRVEAPMRGVIVSLWLEITLSVAGMLIASGFVARHITQTRFVWPAALMGGWFCATLLAAIRQLLAASKVNFNEPIASVQRRLGELRLLRLKTFRWVFLTGQIVWWMPFVITSLQMVLGVDAYRFLTSKFIVANLLAGLLLIPLLLLVSKRFRFAAKASWYARLADVIAGQSLARAEHQARIVADFVR